VGTELEDAVVSKTTTHATTCGAFGGFMCGRPAAHLGDLGKPRCSDHVDICGKCEGFGDIDDGWKIMPCRRCNSTGVRKPA
jgi:hypothetical protein